MRSSFEFFFFVFYANTSLVIVAITPGVVPILGFSRFLDFLKNIFGKMQSRADGEGKCSTIEGGYDIFLFGVAAGGRVCMLGSWDQEKPG